MYGTIAKYPMNDDHFFGGKGNVGIDEVIEDIKHFLEEQPDATYSLVIGTDSHEIENTEKKSKDINLVTAIVVYRKGFGGRYFWRRKKVGNIHSLREKIYAETLESLNFAKKYIPLIKKGLNGSSPDYNLEIHVDVGQHGDTRDMIKEVVGMVVGSGFVAKTKPDSYAASYVADKHT